MKNRANALFAVAVLICLIPATGLALMPYNQDFEGLNQADTAALGNDGWLVYANVFGPDWAYWYGYGPFPAPNDGFGFCQIAAGEGGIGQGAQQLVAFSDYNNGDHGNSAFIESLVFQEMIIGPGDVSEDWVFEFHAKMGNLEGSSTALAFIKTLDPGAGWATTNYITLDMTAIPANWAAYALSITIDPSLDGQILQIGFQNIATNYEGSGVFYDNVRFYPTGPVGTEEMSFGAVKSLFR
ncbi:MAG: hypothetical protein ABFS42_13785 [Candidatus Krumholzibacteriota bacterium]